MTDRCFAIAVPAYQAAATVGEVVARARTLALPGFAGEVLVVDDGSRDATAAAAREAGARVVSHPENRGKGAALATAFADLFARRLDAVVTLDADGQHLPEEVARLAAAWRGEPPEDDDGAGAGDRDGDGVFGGAARGEAPALVIGGREHLFAGMSRLRRLSNRWSSLLISIAAGQRLSDVQSGFRLYDRRLVETVGFPEARFEAESAVVVRAVRAGLRVVTVPVQLGYADGRASSHYRPLVDSLRIARGVLRARCEEYPWARRRSTS